jgi:hypothetical protein
MGYFNPTTTSAGRGEVLKHREVSHSIFHEAITNNRHRTGNTCCIQVLNVINGRELVIPQVVFGNAQYPLCFIDPADTSIRDISNNAEVVTAESVVLPHNYSGDDKTDISGILDSVLKDISWVEEPRRRITF